MTNKEKLFEAIYEACPELTGEVNHSGSLYGYHNPIRLEHLLRTAEARGKNIVIDVWGNIMEIIGENEHGINLNTPICTLDLSLPLSDQSEDTLIQLVKVIL